MDDPQRILHVEDDEDILQITRLSLETLGGFTLMQCSHGQEAVDRAAEFHPDLILMDFMMPGMNGYVTLMELRKIDALAHIPAIFVTAKDLSLEQNPEIASAVIGVIKKPFDAMDLPNQILTLWRKSAVA